MEQVTMSDLSSADERLRSEEAAGDNFGRPECDGPFEPIVQLAKQIFGVQTAVVSLYDQDTEGSAIRLLSRELPGEFPLSNYVLSSREILVVPDARNDNRFSSHPLVLGEPFIQFSAAAPLLSSRGSVLGALSIFDNKSRQGFSANDQEILKGLARQVIEQLELKRLAQNTWAAHCLNRSSPDAIIHIDAVGTIFYANSAAHLIFGYNSDELIGEPLSTLLPLKLQRKMAAVVRKFGRSDNELLSFPPIESIGLHKTKTEIPIEFSAGIWTLNSGFGMGVIIRDITDRKRREASFELLFEHNPIPMWIFDGNTLDFLSVNDAACLLYGYSKGALLRMNALDIRQEGERNEIRSTIKNFGDSYQSELPGTHLTARGDKIRILTFARRMRYGDKDCVVVANIDVTDREQASAELASTRIFLDAIVESIPSMVFVKDATDGRFVLLNKAGEKLLGISRQDLVGKTDFDLFSDDEALRFRQADRDVVASGQLVTVENEPLSTPGGVRSLRTQKIGVPDADGNNRYLLGISEDVTERLKVEERNRHLSLHDILTDLPNRRSFQIYLEQELETEGNHFALLLIDLDRFKAVNDVLGHQAGDELLRQLSIRMLISINGGDVLARLGGDEFAIIHRGDVSESSASCLAERILSVVNQPFNIEGHVVTIGCSLGIVLAPDYGDTADLLIKRGDLALYAAKATGKGGHLFFEGWMEEKAEGERLLRDELSLAMGKNQFEIDYQPIVDTHTGEIACCEALLRWRHPQRGLISPVEFIPAAEASGLIGPLGQWVLEQACQEASRWPSTVKIAVNLSPKQFTGFTLAAGVAKALAESGLAPGRLELEITESIFLTDSQENIRLLNELKSLGVRIALDDFGTGYSSLAYLRRFSFDKLKIDRSFITDVTTSDANLAIVRAVIGLGKSFSAIVTAEGVETADQFNCLTAEGCDQCQGYLLSRPISAQSVLALLNGYRYERFIGS